MNINVPTFVAISLACTFVGSCQGEIDIRLGNQSDSKDAESSLVVIANLRKIRADGTLPEVRHKHGSRTNSNNLTEIYIDWIPPDGGYDGNAMYQLADAVADLKLLSAKRPFATMAQTIGRSLLVLDYRTMLRIADKTIEQPEISQFNGAFPLILLMTIGIVLSIVVPIIGCLYSCCIACCPCECAKRRRDLYYEEAKNQSQTFAAVDGVVAGVTIMVLLSCSGAIFGIAQQLPSQDPLVLKLAKATVGDLHEFFKQLARNLEIIVTQDVSYGTGVMVELVKNMVNSILDPTFFALKGDLDVVYAALDGFDGRFKDTEDNQNLTQAAVTNIISSFDDIVVEINQVINDMKTLAADGNQCIQNLDGSTAASTLCMKIGGIGSALTLMNPPAITLDFSKIGEILENIRKVDPASFGEVGANVKKDMASMLDQSTQGVQNSTLDALMGISDMITPLVSDMTETMAKFMDELEGYEKILDENHETYLPIRNYTILGVAGFSSVVFILGLMFTIGLMMGMTNCASELPENRHNGGDFGGRMLKGAVNLSFCYVIFFLLVGSIMMFFGVGLSVICADSFDSYKAIRMLDDPDTFEGRSLIGEHLLNDSKIVLKLEDILENCRVNNTAAYTVLKLEKRFSFEEAADVSGSLPSNELLDTKIKDALSGVSVLKAEDEKNMEDLATNSRKTVNALNMTALPAILKDSFAKTETLISEMVKTLETDIVEPLKTINAQQSYVTAWEDQVSDLTGTQNKISDLIKRVDNDFTPPLTELNQAVSSLIDLVDDIRLAMVNVENFLSAGKANDKMMEGLNNFIDQLLKLADSLLAHITGTLENDLARCEIFWNLYEGLGTITCNVFLHYLNTLWLALLVMGYVLLIGMWSFSKLARHFLIPVDIDDFVDRKYFDVRELPPKLEPLFPYMAYPEDWDIPHPTMTFEVRRDMTDDMT